MGMSQSLLQTGELCEGCSRPIKITIAKEKRVSWHLYKQDVLAFPNMIIILWTKVKKAMLKFLE